MSTIKKRIAVFHPLECSGCLGCQISCAQLHSGSSRAADSRLRVLQPAALANPTVLVSARCDCPDGVELCQRVCGPMALRFVPREELQSALRAGWQIAPNVE